MSFRVNNTEVLNNSAEILNLTDIRNSVYGSLTPVSTLPLTSSVSLLNPVSRLNLVSAANISLTNISDGRNTMILLDTGTQNYEPNFIGTEWPGNIEPVWSDFRYWVVSIICWNNNTLGNAVGYDSI